jgi:hypothetical protein
LGRRWEGVKMGGGEDGMVRRWDGEKKKKCRILNKQ